MGKSKKGRDQNISKFDGLGVDFKCKLIGFTDVPAARGDDICQSAMTKLKMVALKNNKEKKEHKQKITVNITLKGIRILDETTERIDHAHPIHRISFISHDNDDKRTFAYIVGTKEGYKLFAIKSMKEAEQITSTMKELFQEVFERYQAKKKEESVDQAEEVTENAPAVASVPDEKPQQSNGENVNQEQTYEDPKDAFEDWGQLNEQIQVMQNDSFQRSNSFDLLADVTFSSNITTSDHTNNDPFGGNNFGSSSQTTAQDDFNPFGDSNSFAANPQQQQKQNDIDFFASPPVPSRPSAPGNPASDDLYSVVSPPPKTNGQQQQQPTDSEAPLLINDPFAELKKNINEMHKQNQMQQQQQPQFGYFPAQNVASPAYGNQGNPFATQPFGAPQQPQNPYQQPVIPPRPAAAINPFSTTAVPAPAPTPQQQEFGWTVTKPTPAPRKVPTPVTPANNNSGSDPFAFLDNQTGNDNTSTSNGMASHEFQQPIASTSASGQIFDLLG